MSTQAQINANRENAKLSTGPVTETGSARSSRNAVKHGLTGQTIYISPEEAEAYASHVDHYLARYQPIDYHHRQLVQQLADSDWGVHQVFLQQSATISYMQKLSRRLADAEPDAEAEIQKADAQAVRKLATLNSYENRKRRTSKLLLEQLQALEEQRQTVAKPSETKQKRDIGFVLPDWMTQEQLLQLREHITPFADENGDVPEGKILEFIAKL